jgi:hypothetical protein
LSRFVFNSWIPYFATIALAFFAGLTSAFAIPELMGIRHVFVKASAQVNK